MWMGGMVPLGYDKNPDPKIRGLIVNGIEAETVRAVFELYNVHGCLRVVQEEAARTGIRSKRRKFTSGKTYGGGVLSRGQIHFLLTNPIYIGLIRHKDQTWPGQHEAIIGAALWESVQAKLQAASARPRTRGKTTDAQTQATVTSQLAGKVRDETGDRLTPTHTTRRGKRMRYYVSNRLLSGHARDDASGWRLPAPALEQAIARVVADHIEACADRQALIACPSAESAARTGKRARTLAQQIRRDEGMVLRDVIVAGRIAPGVITVELSRRVVAVAIGVPAEDLSGDALAVEAPFQLRRRGVETRIIAGNPETAPDRVLVQRLADADRWVAALRAGKQLSGIARRDGHSPSYIRVRSQIAFLSPRIQAAILDGTQPAGLSLERIIRTGVPLDWSEQERIFDFEA
jgi:hypothetical protein